MRTEKLIKMLLWMTMMSSMGRPTDCEEQHMMTNSADRMLMSRLSVEKELRSRALTLAYGTQSS